MGGVGLHSYLKCGTNSRPRFSLQKPILCAQQRQLSKGAGPGSRARKAWHRIRLPERADSPKHPRTICFDVFAASHCASESHRAPSGVPGAAERRPRPLPARGWVVLPRIMPARGWVVLLLIASGFELYSSTDGERVASRWRQCSALQPLIRVRPRAASSEARLRAPPQRQ